MNAPMLCDFIGKDILGDEKRAARSTCHFMSILVSGFVLVISGDVLMFIYYWRGPLDRLLLSHTQRGRTNASNHTDYT